MSFRAAAFVGMALLLSGCSDDDLRKAFTYDTDRPAGAVPVQTADLPPSTSVSPAPPATLPMEAANSPAATPSYSVTQTVTTIAPVIPTNATASYCQSIARNTGATATRDGMDDAEQQQTADAAYRRCMAFYGASAR